MDEQLWVAVEQQPAENRTEQQLGTRVRSPNLLAGLVYDAEGARLIPTHATKKGRRYRYDISKHLQTNGSSTPGSGLRIPAVDLERVVSDRLLRFLTDRAAVYAATKDLGASGTAQQQILTDAANLAATWPEQPLAARRSMLRRLLADITVHPSRIDLRLSPEQLSAPITGSAAAISCPQHDQSEQAGLIMLSAKIAIKRAGMEMWLIVQGVGAEPDATLIKLIVKARQLRDKLIQGEIGAGELAEREGLTSSYVTRVVRLSYLAPDIVAAILKGRQPIGLTANKLLLDSRLPLAWTEQLQVLGFG